MSGVAALLGKRQGAVIIWALQRGAAGAGEEEEEKKRRREGSMESFSHVNGTAQLNSPCPGNFESCVARLCWNNLTE